VEHGRSDCHDYSIQPANAPLPAVERIRWKNLEAQFIGATDDSQRLRCAKNERAMGRQCDFLGEVNVL
jgi:hypothetical protein